MNTTSEPNVEEFHPLVGFEVGAQFEEKVGMATAELALALQNQFVDQDTKVRYATHVFAKMLDELAELVSLPELLN